MAVLLRKMLWWWPQYDLHRDSKLQDITSDDYRRVEDGYMQIEDHPRDLELRDSSTQQLDADSSMSEVRVLLHVNITAIV